jgi:hypothetical protein
VSFGSADLRFRARGASRRPIPFACIRFSLDSTVEDCAWTTPDHEFVVYKLSTRTFAAASYATGAARSTVVSFEHRGGAAIFCIARPSRNDCCYGSIRCWEGMSQMQMSDSLLFAACGYGRLDVVDRHCQLTLPDGSIAVLGGEDPTGEDQNDVWSSRDRGSSWRRVCKHAPWAARSYFGSCFVRGKLVVFGGNHGPFDAWESSDRGSSWQKLPAAGITGELFCFGFCANREGSIFVIGGYDGDWQRPKSEVHRSDDGGRSWRLVHSGGSWSARHSLSAVCTASGELVLMGGWDGRYRNDVWVSADGRSGWSLACASAPWTARRLHQSVCTADGAIVLMGGYDGGRKNDVWSSRDAGRTWMCVVSAAPWAARYDFGASVVGEPRRGGAMRRSRGGGSRGRRECAVVRGAQPHTQRLAVSGGSGMRECVILH